MWSLSIVACPFEYMGVAQTKRHYILIIYTKCLFLYSPVNVCQWYNIYMQFSISSTLVYIEIVYTTVVQQCSIYRIELYELGLTVSYQTGLIFCKISIDMGNYRQKGSKRADEFLDNVGGNWIIFAYCRVLIWMLMKRTCQLIN